MAVCTYVCVVKAGISHVCHGSAHSSGCAVNGSNAMAGVLVIIVQHNYIQSNGGCVQVFKRVLPPPQWVEASGTMQC